MTDQEKRQKFHDLRAEVEALEAQLAPTRAQYEKAVKDFNTKITPIKAQLKEAEKPIFDKKQEIGQLARELRGPDGISRTSLTER